LRLQWASSRFRPLRVFTPRATFSSMTFSISLRTTASSRSISSGGRPEDQLIMYLRYHLQPYQFTITSLPEYCLHRRIVERRTPRGDSSNETFNDTLSLWNSRNIFTIQKPAFQLKVGIRLQAESLIRKLIPSLHERPVYPCHYHHMDSIIRPNL